MISFIFIILFSILFIIFIPIKVKIQCNNKENLVFYIVIFKFKFNLLKKGSKNKINTNSNYKKIKINKIKFNFVKKIIDILMSSIVLIFKKIKNIDFQAEIGGEDVYEVFKKYNFMFNIINIFYSFVLCFKNPNRVNICIKPNFLVHKINFKFECIFVVNIFFVLYLLGLIFINILRYSLSQKKLLRE